ncbi:hypothetical protein GCM10011491_35350 [Brucella endophytica]|uniref:Uncharacterized protein n=1 Tax=Brucella endophytica TaxID=1963359 RepID=A0A916WIH2_9HYPH|nr:hypothetical protein GCM10011491_35350 [Brucella endophytica]
MADFYSARSGTIPPLPWTNSAPPLSLASTAPTRSAAAALSEFRVMVLIAVGYFQPVTRGELSKIFGKE